MLLRIAALALAAMITLAAVLVAQRAVGLDLYGL